MIGETEFVSLNQAIRRTQPHCVPVTRHIDGRTAVAFGLARRIGTAWRLALSCPSLSISRPLPLWPKLCPVDRLRICRYGCGEPAPGRTDASLDSHPKRAARYQDSFSLTCRAYVAVPCATVRANECAKFADMLGLVRSNDYRYFARRVARALAHTPTSHLVLYACFPVIGGYEPPGCVWYYTQATLSESMW